MIKTKPAITIHLVKFRCTQRQAYLEHVINLWNLSGIYTCNRNIQNYLEISTLNHMQTFILRDCLPLRFIQLSYSIFPCLIQISMSEKRINFKMQRKIQGHDFRPLISCHYSLYNLHMVYSTQNYCNIVLRASLKVNTFAFVLFSFSFKLKVYLLRILI